jgi:hypothetical protein
MTTYTPAQEFLSEVHEISGFIDDIIACPRKTGWHWPSFYLLYVDVDRLAVTLVRTEHFFAPPLTGLWAPAGMDERVDTGNAVLDELGKRQKAIFGWFHRMSRQVHYGGADTMRRARLDAHIHPKSGWYQVFFAEYDAGSLAEDGKTLTRTVLPVLAEPPYERVDHVTASCLLRRQAFALGTPEEDMALADASRQAAERVGETAARMQAYLREHCTLEDLLYPCSA